MQRLINNTLDYFEKHRILSSIIVILFFTLILYPRFNMQDIAIIRPFTGVEAGEMTPDQKNYYNFTEYFKGSKGLNEVYEPFNYRPLLPFIASLLPFDSLLSLSIINVLANILTLMLLLLILKELNFNFGLRIIALLLYIVSFPLFYYGSSAFLEPTSNLFIYLIVYLIISGKKIWLPLTFALAAITKEVTIIAFPFAFVYYLLEYSTDKGQRIKSMLILLLSFILFVTANVLVRSYFATDNQYLWSPSLQTAIGNLSRLKTYLSFILSFGIPGFLAILYAAKHKQNVISKMLLPYYVGMFFSIMLSIYSIIAAYSDGRFIWTGMAFMIIISLYFIRNIADTNIISAEKQ